MLREASPLLLCCWGRERSQPLEPLGGPGWAGCSLTCPSLPKGGPKAVRSNRVGETLTWGSFASGSSFQCTDSHTSHVT